MGSRDEGQIRLYLSVDLVGSTAFKETAGQDGDGRIGPAWANVFTEFYSFFPRFFEREYAGEILEEGIRPQVVKAIGDELLLETEIKNHRDARKVVEFFALAMAEYKRKNLWNRPLLLKGTAWIAGFPINNHKASATGARGQDGIGPSIDAGFRLAKFATPAKLVVSVDLALLMLHGRGKCELYCDGFESLKGVLGGRPYPLLWYPVATEDDELEKLARNVTNKTPPPMDDLKRYCEAFIKAAKGTWLCRPYFKNDPEFGEVPSEHLTKYQQADDYDALHDQQGKDPTDGEPTPVPQPPASAESPLVDT